MKSNVEQKNVEKRRDFMKTIGGLSLALVAFFTIPSIFASKKTENTKKDEE